LGEAERRSKRGDLIGLWPALARSIAFAHSATAKQYCPSSSTVARQFEIAGGEMPLFA